MEKMSNKFSSYIRDIEQETSRLWKDLKQPFPEDAVRPLLLAGKRLRPLLAILAGESVGRNYKEVLEFIPIAEGLHISALIQDDLIDNAMIRHGVPAVHVEYDMPTALLVSDFLIFKSYDILFKASQRLNIPEKETIYLLQVINNACIKCIIGEYLDYIRTGFDTNLDEYTKIMALKTGSQFEASASIGAILGGGTENQIKVLSEFGYHIGMAHQIKDDILDIIGSSDVIGKQTGKDVEGKFLNFVWIHAIEKDASKFIKIAKTLGEEEHGSVKRFLIEKGHIRYAEEKAREQIAKAIDVVEKSNLRKKDELKLLAKYIIERQF